MHASSAGALAAARKARPSPRLLAGGGATVLLCDRNDDIHAMYGAFLEHRGFAVVHARSVPDCLRLVRSRPLAAVIVSVGSRGLFLWKSWRPYLALARAARSTGFAVVCLTTDPRLAAGARRNRRCAAAVLMLPCAPEALAAEVERAIGEARRPPN